MVVFDLNLYAANLKKRQEIMGRIYEHNWLTVETD